MAKKHSSLKKNRSNTAKSVKVQQKIASRFSKTKPLKRNNESIKTGDHSLNPDREKKNANYRDRAKINRIKMYKGGKPIRDKHGQIVKAASFQSTLASGTVARVEPNRKWFGNTRIVGQKELQKFQVNLGKAMEDPYQVVLRQTRMPITLLQERAKNAKVHIVDTEPFENTFGKKATRKKANVQADDLEALTAQAQSAQDKYVPKVIDDSEGKDENPNPLFRAGQSQRIWGELYKVIDSSDVLLIIVDARDPIGTRCTHVEQFLRKEKPHKHVVLVLNKVDLVPTWVTKKWLGVLSTEYPTVAFHANMQNAFGKGTLINLLRQFAKLHKERQQISVGFIGYPNVGKSSVINTLRKKKVCNVAPIAGETKVWQYVTLMKRVYLIDCPGVVYNTGDDESQLVLKGVVRVENVPQPSIHIPALMAKVTREHLGATYSVADWTDAEDLLSQIAKRSGRLLKGGEPDHHSVAKMMLNDFQRGKIPFYTLPPGCDLPPPEAQQQLVDDLAKTANPDDQDGENDEDDAASLTDIGSTCSGLSDISGVSDLEASMSDLDADVERKEAETSSKSKKPVGQRRDPKQRGKRGGDKNKKKIPKAKHAMDTFASGKSSLGAKYWKKKKEKKVRKSKHQQ